MKNSKLYLIFISIPREWTYSCLLLMLGTLTGLELIDTVVTNCIKLLNKIDE